MRVHLQARVLLLLFLRRVGRAQIERRKQRPNTHTHSPLRGLVAQLLHPAAVVAALKLDQLHLRRLLDTQQHTRTRTLTLHPHLILVLVRLLDLITITIRCRVPSHSLRLHVRVRARVVMQTMTQPQMQDRLTWTTIDQRVFECSCAL